MHSRFSSSSLSLPPPSPLIPLSVSGLPIVIRREYKLLCEKYLDTLMREKVVSLFTLRTVRICQALDLFIYVKRRHCSQAETGRKCYYLELELSPGTHFSARTTAELKL